MNLRLWMTLLRIALLLTAFVLPMSDGAAQRAQTPQKRPSVEKPDKKAASEDDEDDDGDDEDEKPQASEKPAAKDDDDDKAAERGETMDDASVDEGRDGMPPLPLRAPQRGVKRSAEPLGPEPPPAKWSDAEVSEAKSVCARLLKDGAYDYKPLEPIKEGTCGAPAPVRLVYINDVPRIELRPGAVITCPLADALDRWLREVVQPRAKALLDANVIRLGNMSAYQCRNRYNSATERISHHAFAEALDVSEFVTAKGEHINVLEHWPVKDERSQFLRDVHEGACKIFGTVLGPEANAAHKNHFHLDMAKRRRSAYCQ